MTFHEIKKRIIKAQKEVKPIHYVAFDADGTLWNNDVLYHFLEYQIQKGLLCGKRSRNLWQKLISEPKNKKKNLMAISNLFAGLTVREVRKRAQKAFDYFPSGIFKEQKEFIKWLQNRGIKIYVVSASYKWALEPAIKAMGLPVDCIIAVENAVKNGVIHRKLKGEVSISGGKVRRLFEKTKKKRPLMAAGNTLWDADLIETASHVKMAVGCQSCFDFKLRKLEKKLADKAKKKGWLIHEFA